LTGVFFVLRYSAATALHFSCEATALGIESRKYRGLEERRLLHRLRGRIVVAATNCSRLFYGSATSVLQTVLAQVGPDTQFLLMDLTSIQSLDALAMAAFQTQVPSGVDVVLTSLKPHLQEDVAKASLDVRLFDSLNHGLEWCEDQLLQQELSPVPNECSRGASLIALPTTSGIRQEDSMPLERTEKQEPMEPFAALRLCFPDAPVRLLHEFLSWNSQSFAREERICEEGQIAESMMICLSGSCTLYQKTCPSSLEKGLVLILEVFLDHQLQIT